VLQLASCVGDGFELDSLVELTDSSRSELEGALYTLCDEGLVAPGGPGFRFVHDRVREAAQLLLAPEERARLHRQVALQLIARTPAEGLSFRAAEIADHLNMGLPQDDADQLRALQMNLLAGQRALRAGAAETAANYLTAARALFRDTHWTSHPQLGFDLFLEAAEAAYQTREIDLALQLLSILEVHPLSRMQAAQVAAKVILTRSLDANKNAALPFVLHALRSFGIRWPSYPSRLRTHLALLRTEWILRGPLDERLFSPAAPVDHSRWFAPFVIIAASGHALTHRSVRLICLATCHALSCYRQHGHLIGTSFALAGYASHRVGFLRDARSAERYARAALDWDARFPHPVYSARTEFLVHAYLYSWTRPRRALLEPLRRAAEQCREAGDIGYLTYANNHRVLMGALSGATPLPRLATEIGESRILQTTADKFLELQARITDLLLHPQAEEATSQLSHAIREDLRSYATTRMGPWVWWLEALCLLGRYAEAHSVAEEISTWIEDVGCMSSQVVDFTFFRGVSAAEQARALRGLARRRQQRLLRRCLRELSGWARLNPDFVHMTTALQAEQEALRERTRHALAAYVEASDRASEHGYHHHSAFLHERRARLLSAAGRRTEAVAALRRAQSLYEEWGAGAKAEALRSPISHPSSAHRR
jgi:hypothetical protein